MHKSKTEQKEKIYGHKKELHIHETELEKDAHGHETDFKKSWNFVKC